MEQLDREWTKNQVRLQEWLSMPRVSRSPPTQELLADDMGVNWRTLTRWKKLPGWMEEVNRIARAGLERGLPDVYGALLREAAKGSIHHIRTVLELVGELGPEVQDGRTQIAIVFNDKDIQAIPDRLEPNVESTPGTINLLPLQRGGLWSEVGQNGNGGGPSVSSTNGDG